MCMTCGCSDAEGEASLHVPATGERAAIPLTLPTQAAFAHDHGHDHGHGHGHGHDHHHDHGPAELIVLEQRVLASNDRLAGQNRARFAEAGLVALNLMSSPGAGKTTLLVRTLSELPWPSAVLEGDQETSHDAERIRATGAPVVQINTGKGCHLEADMVRAGLERLTPEPGSVLFIENVGNLVCPALFDLGEAAKVVLFSVTEGEDKPEKYPHMFRAADLVLLTKLDLLPYLDFDLERCLAALRTVNPDAPVLQVSARSGQGLNDWYAWIAALRDSAAPLGPEETS